MEAGHEASTFQPGRELACTLTAGVLRRVRSVCGESTLPELLSLAGSARSVEFLDDNANWVSVGEAVDLLEAAQRITGDADVARRVGEDAVSQYAGTQVATVLRSLGSPQEMLRQIATVATKFTTVSRMEVIEVAPGRAIVSRRQRRGGHAHPLLCQWASGLLSAAPLLYAVPAARVVETECEARGHARCLFEVTWDAAASARAADPQEHIRALEAQVVALNQRSASMYAAAGDLIADDDLGSILAKIVERSATAVRAARYLLVVRPQHDADLQIHHRGVVEGEVQALAQEILSAGRGPCPCPRAVESLVGRELRLADPRNAVGFNAWGTAHLTKLSQPW